jgi:hypothetical protein
LVWIGSIGVRIGAMIRGAILLLAEPELASALAETSIVPKAAKTNVTVSFMLIYCLFYWGLKVDC